MYLEGGEQPLKLFWVLCVVWQDGIAERRGVGQVLEEALEAEEVLDAAIGGSEAQRAALWRIREEHPEAQRLAGASVKNDVSVPVSKTPELMRRCSEAMRALVPGSVPVPFGHLGDGNIHMNLLQPEGMDPAAFLARSHDIIAIPTLVRQLPHPLRKIIGDLSNTEGVLIGLQLEPRAPR